MANVVIDDFHLMNIAENIRLMNGETVPYKPREMSEAIFRIPVITPMIITNGRYFNFNGNWDEVINVYGDKMCRRKGVPYMKTEGLTDCYSMFNSSKLKKIPFDINCSTTDECEFEGIFQYCRQLEEIPKLSGKIKSGKNMFQYCERLRNVPADMASWFDWSALETATSAYKGYFSAVFNNCFSLRSVPVDFFAKMNPSLTSYNNTYFCDAFMNCYVLNELVNLPVPYTKNFTSNMFRDTVKNCHRLKEFTFAMPNGSPYVRNWKSQILDLSQYAGYAQFLNDITGYNSGITADKEVKDDATYQALKNNPDWFTLNVAYSRYNHDSAVNTINSLPDCSSSGGTNTIKFKGAAGSATDGGAINTLTEEEIAVATAKGWTVSLV